jgi:hypothetical protein
LAAARLASRCISPLKAKLGRPFSALEARLEGAGNYAIYYLHNEHELVLALRDAQIAREPRRAPSAIAFWNRTARSDSNLALDVSREPAERFDMAETVQPGPAPLQVVLERVDPREERGALLCPVGRADPVCEGYARSPLGAAGLSGRQRLELFDSEGAATLALETWLARKRRRGYAVK